MILRILTLTFLGLAMISCNQDSKSSTSIKVSKSAAEILGNPDYQAMSYGGYRHKSRDQQPTVVELKEDMLILHALGVRIIRTYQTKLPHAINTLKAIKELKEADPNFEMYVMLGAWINCENAWTGKPNHEGEDAQENEAEVARAIKYAQDYPDIVKVIAVGNEAMVKWAAAYFVQPRVILKYVNQLQQLKTDGALSSDLWVTSSDNFASWGGGDGIYHTDDLTALIKAVDYISMHTYPMHDTHYNPNFWGNTSDEEQLENKEKIDKAMVRAMEYATNQYLSVKKYLANLGINKPIHIGETGWASSSNGFYGPGGSKACDEYKEGKYYHLINQWTDDNKIACFYFEAFNEPWKDAQNQGGSENHFGLFTVDGQAKYALWKQVDAGVFDGLTRGGNQIRKTYGGDEKALLDAVNLPPVKQKIVMNN